MSISAVGFLFEVNAKKNPIHKRNYLCTLHKLSRDGRYSKEIINTSQSTPAVKSVMSSDEFKSELRKTVASVCDKHSPDKFTGAAIKDELKETEIHSFFSDKLYAVRTKDNNGKIKFNILSGKKTKQILSECLDLNA